MFVRVFVVETIRIFCDGSIVFLQQGFATELSTNLVYYSIFVIDYNYICINLLFFFTIKLSIFSRLCVKQNKSWSGQHTLRYKNSTLI